MDFVCRLLVLLIGKWRSYMMAQTDVGLDTPIFSKLFVKKLNLNCIVRHKNYLHKDDPHLSFVSIDKKLRVNYNGKAYVDSASQHASYRSYLECSILSIGLVLFNNFPTSSLKNINIICKKEYLIRSFSFKSGIISVQVSLSNT